MIKNFKDFLNEKKNDVDLYDLIMDKMRDFNKFRAMGYDEKLMKSIKEICKEKKIKISNLPSDVKNKLKKAISNNLQGDKASIWLKNNL